MGKALFLYRKKRFYEISEKRETDFLKMVRNCGDCLWVYPARRKTIVKHENCVKMDL